MAIFGSMGAKPKLSSPFGAPFGKPEFPYGTPPIAPDSIGGYEHGFQDAPAKKPSFFGEGGAGRAIAGYIGDALLQMNGMQPIYAPNMRDNRRADMERQQQEQQRRSGWEDWVAREQWKRANPEPLNNDTVADYEFRKRTLGKAAADAWLNSASDPIVTVTLPGNRVYSGPRSGLAAALGGGQGGTAPSNQPPSTLPPDFDFGNGGPTPRASGRFP